MTERIAVSVDEACRQLGDCSRATVYRWVKSRHLDLRKVGGRSLITMESIRALIEGEAA